MWKDWDYPLLGIYHEEIPDFVRAFANTAAMRRLADVGMNCGCEYTALHASEMHFRYTRFQHSVGVALIIWHVTHDPRQTIAGLLHDISTPAFAHVVDFMNGDHLTQESTEERTAEFIDRSEEMQRMLQAQGLCTDDVCDYHRYPIADNDSPQLSADRLEYTFGNLLQYGFADVAQIEAFYRALSVGVNEHGEPELVFADREIAEAFALCTMQCSHLYVSDGDRFTMQYLADLLKHAAEWGVVTVDDLYTTETAVIERLLSDSRTAELWQAYRRIAAVRQTTDPTADGYCVQVDAKRRYLDPYVTEAGRVTGFSGAYRRQMVDFLSVGFDGWLSQA